MRYYKSFLSTITIAVVIGCLSFNWLVSAQVTTTQSPDSGLPAVVPDNIPAGVNLPFTFSGLTGSLTNVRVEGVTWSPTHTWAGDVTMTLTAPGGSPSAVIHQRKGRATPCTAGAGSSSGLTGPYTFRDDPTGSPGNFHTVAGTPVPSGQYQATRCLATAGEVVLMDPIFMGPAFSPDFLLTKNYLENKEKGLEAFENLPPQAANGTWTLNINDQAAGDTGSITAVQLSLVTNTPTAGNAVIKGRTILKDGRALPNVIVTLIGGPLTEPLVTRSNVFGNFEFREIEAGQTYILNVESGKTIFNNPTRVIDVNENVQGIVFVAEDN